VIFIDMGRGTSFNERDGFRPAGARPISTTHSGGNSGVFIEQDKYVPVSTTPTSETNNNASTFFEKDWFPLLGINPATNNYPVAFPPSDEQIITDAILTTTGDYIAVGDNIYLRF